MSLLSRINKKTIIIPSLATLLFIYGVTGIRAAKSNAQRHRDADTGGEGLSLVNENRRRHGMESRIHGSGSTVGELASEARSQLFGGKEDGVGGEVREKEKEKVPSKSGKVELQERLRELKGRGREGGG